MKMKKITLLTLATAILLGGGMLVYKDVKADTETPPKPLQTQARQHQEERLQEAVTAGVITNEQADALQAKREEMRTQHEQERQAHKQEMQTWAEQNGIDLNALHEYMGKGFGRGMRW
ncbi:MAG: hypothetical protein ABH814_00925 [bacterium]